MSRSEALKAAQKKYRGTRERVELIMSADERKAAQTAAESSGMSVNAYIKAAIREKMERDAAE